MGVPRGASLFGAEEAVAGIPETRHDIAVVVQMTIDRAGVDAHVLAGPVDLFDALGRCDEHQQVDVLGALLAE